MARMQEATDRLNGSVGLSLVFGLAFELELTKILFQPDAAMAGRKIAELAVTSYPSFW